jgi:hypothetical protein
VLCAVNKNEKVEENPEVCAHSCLYCTGHCSLSVKI